MILAMRKAVPILKFKIVKIKFIISKKLQKNKYYIIIFDIKIKFGK